jgi:hypothetical protein
MGHKLTKLQGCSNWHKLCQEFWTNLARSPWKFGVILSTHEWVWIQLRRSVTRVKKWRNFGVARTDPNFVQSFKRILQDRPESLVWFWVRMNEYESICGNKTSRLGHTSPFLITSLISWLTLKKATVLRWWLVETIPTSFRGACVAMSPFWSCRDVETGVDYSVIQAHKSRKVKNHAKWKGRQKTRNLPCPISAHGSQIGEVFNWTSLSISNSEVIFGFAWTEANRTGMRVESRLS